MNLDGLYLGDCIDILPTLATASVDVVITDPPYGCGKAEWDDSFPVKWYQQAKRITPTVVIITGSSGLKDSIALVGDDFLDVVAAWNLNGMTRGPLGFNNWLAAVVAGVKPTKGNGSNFFEFSVRGEMPDHPSPKPIEYMHKIITRLTKEGDTVLDCFMGSGTTGVACAKLGRKFIGIESNPQYFSIASKRIGEARSQLIMELA